MSDIKLFRLFNGHAAELQGSASDLEKPLQTLIEANLVPLLNIRFLVSEHSTGKTHSGRIDSLGLDENNCPVILGRAARGVHRCGLHQVRRPRGAADWPQH